MSNHRKPPTRAEQVWQWVRHHSPLLLIGSLAAALVARLVGSWPLHLAVIAAMAAATFGFVAHLFPATGCDRCIVAQTSATPEGAQKRMEWLRGEHWLRDNAPWFMLVFFALVAAQSVTVNTAVLIVLNLLVSAQLAAMYLVTWHHTRYRALCPWCRDNDDPGWPVVEPDPDPAATKTVT